MSDSTEQAPEESRAVAPGTANGVESLVNGVPVVEPLDWKAIVPRIPRKPDAPPAAEMTISQAADYLDVPRSYIVKRVRGGELPCRVVKNRRRIPRAALEELKEKIFQRAKEAADEMSRIAQELGLYEEELGKKAQ
jgi:excisionase family DNA binding protein